MTQADLGGAAWPRQFIFRFRLIGTLGRNQAYPVGTKPRPPDFLAHADLWGGIQTALYVELKNPVFKNGRNRRKEAADQFAKGWPTKPFSLRAPISSSELRASDLNTAFRLGVAPTGKLCACDDLRHSRANLGIRVLTPSSWSRGAISLSYPCSRPLLLRLEVS